MITKCPYLCGPDVLFHPDCTTKSIKLDYSSVTDGVIKGGSPINAAGKVANDATAIGVLRRDCYEGYHPRGQVIIGGYVDQDKAQQNSGIVLAGEPKAAMANVLFVDDSGVPRPGVPAGYPSKSGWSIEWDGNTEGLVAVEAGGEAIYKVSDLTPTYDELIGSIVERSDGNKVEIASDYVVVISEDITTVGFLLVIKKDNATFAETTFPQKGTYFVKNSDGYTTKLSKQIITPMAEEFLPNIPADKLPTGAITTLHINVTAVNTETMEATFTADKTPVEMRQASANGPVWCVVSFPAGLLSEEAVSIGVPPAWYGGAPAFGGVTTAVHGDDGSNKIVYAVRQGLPDTWILDLSGFGS